MATYKIATVADLVTKFGSGYAISGLSTNQCFRRELIPSNLYCPYFYASNQLVPIEFISHTPMVTAKITNIITTPEEVLTAKITKDGSEVSGFYFMYDSRRFGHHNLVIMAQYNYWMQLVTSTTNFPTLTIGSKSSIQSTTINETIQTAVQSASSSNWNISFEWTLVDVDKVVTMTVTDLDEFLTEQDMSLEDGWVLADPYDNSELDGGLYPTAVLSNYDGIVSNTITGTVQQWINLYNILYDPEGEIQGAVLINQGNGIVLNINHSAFTEAITNIVTNLQDTNVCFRELYTLTVTDWETLASNSGYDCSSTWMLNLEDSVLDGGLYPTSQLYYQSSEALSPGTDDVIVGSLAQWQNLKDAVAAVEDDWGLFYLANEDDDNTISINTDNLADAVSTILESNADVSTTFMYSSEGGSGSGSESTEYNTVTIPIRARTYVSSEDVEINTFIRLVAHEGVNTYYSNWVNYADNDQNTQLSTLLTSFDISYPSHYSSMASGVYFTVELRDLSTSDNATIAVRSYFNGGYQDSYDDYTWGTDVFSGDSLSFLNQQFVFNSSFEFNADRFIEIAFNCDYNNDVPELDGQTSWSVQNSYIRVTATLPVSGTYSFIGAVKSSTGFSGTVMNEWDTFVDNNVPLSGIQISQTTYDFHNETVWNDGNPYCSFILKLDNSTRYFLYQFDMSADASFVYNYILDDSQSWIYGDCHPYNWGTKTYIREIYPY